jgi:hypothetical protein
MALIKSGAREKPEKGNLKRAAISDRGPGLAKAWADVSAFARAVGFSERAALRNDAGARIMV